MPLYTPSTTSNHQDLHETDQRCLLRFPTKGTSCCGAWHRRTTSQLLQYSKSSVFFWFMIINYFNSAIKPSNLTEPVQDRLKGSVSSIFFTSSADRNEHWASCPDTESSQNAKQAIQGNFQLKYNISGLNKCVSMDVLKLKLAGAGILN